MGSIAESKITKEDYLKTLQIECFRGMKPEEQEIILKYYIKLAIINYGTMEIFKLLNETGKEIKTDGK